MIYTVTFNPAIDYVVHVRQMQAGTVNRTWQEDVQYGGKGINVSTVLQNLGVENVALGFLAGFTGRAIEDGLAAAHIRSDFIHLSSGLSRINVKIKSGQETEINGLGPSIPQDAINRLFKQLERLMPDDILVLAGSIPSTLPHDIYETIMARLQGKNIRVVVDATRDLLMNVLKYHPFLIKPNHVELGEIFGRFLKNDDEIAVCAAKLQRQGARNVLISMAGEGALLLDETGKRHRMGVPAGQVKNSVGAGDSMVAGFLAGFLEKQDYAHALRLGTAAGSATAFSAGLAARGDILALMDKL